MLDDQIYYYATNVLQMRKTKIDACELIASRTYHKNYKKNVIDQNNIQVKNKNNLSFKISIDFNTILKSLVN